MLDVVAKALCKGKAVDKYCRLNVHSPVGYNIGKGYGKKYN